MAEQLTKLRPDRDLQCYFQEPSTVAALSQTSVNGFTISGCWRQQFDWVVLEWNRDNVFEHPALRNLPDGDLSGVRLSYDETRANCVPLDSTLYDSLEWSKLRIWEEHDTKQGNVEDFHEVLLKNHASPLEGDYVAPAIEFELLGSLTTGDLIELSWLEDHCNYQIAEGDTAESALSGLAAFINQKQLAGCVVTATAVGSRITLTYTGAVGANGNRAGAYGGVHGAGTESWVPTSGRFAGGTSPTRWHLDLDFGNLIDTNGQKVVTTNVRKIRWTWTADLQVGNFQRTEFSVITSNWSVSGSGLGYCVAGPGSRRIQDGSPEVDLVGSWARDTGNYSGGSIRYTETKGDQIHLAYAAPFTHTLFLGTRYLGSGADITIQVDGNSPITMSCRREQEDVLVRHPIGQLSAGSTHSVTVSHDSDTGSILYFDFFELAVPAANLPTFNLSPNTTLATDWDTNHSLAIAPERTAWLISKLGFKGRANHYAGAMWFYELNAANNVFASATVLFGGVPQFMDVVQITLGVTAIQHVVLTSDTTESIAKCFELLINAGSSSVWAQAQGSTLNITSRTMGTAGNDLTVCASTISAGGSDGKVSATVSGAALSGGLGASSEKNSAWRTDLNAMPRLNRAVRDWSCAFYQALKGYGIDVATAFSMELQHGDDSLEVGIAQRYPGGPVWVNTPALQTNFSPISIDFWKQVYLDMADVMSRAGIVPYLQFGEVQWWYKADDGSGMPFYDDYTKSAFQGAYADPISLIPNQNADPALYPRECVLLPSLIGQFTASTIAYVKQSYPTCRFEVLYPHDVNDTPLNRLINYPVATWTPANLACLKTENFIYTGDRNLDKARESIGLPSTLGFPASRSSHLIGIGDPTSPWERERRLSFSNGVESVVLFALDQFCLIGYGVPLDGSRGSSRFMGK